MVAAGPVGAAAEPREAAGAAGEAASNAVAGNRLVCNITDNFMAMGYGAYLRANCHRS